MTKQVLAHYRKQPAENLRYFIDYTEWLEEQEEITEVNLSIDNETDPPLVCDQVVIEDGNKSFGYMVSGGLAGEQYQVTVLATTDTGQIVEREVRYTVEEI